jgi:RHS repeat-associated protein
LVDVYGYIKQMYEYSSFGEIRVLDEEGKEIDPEDGIPNPYTFTGREYDPETGLYYYRARYYDPGLGRFLQEDPIWGDPRALSLYTYVDNNPLNWVDPYGLSKLDPITCNELKKHCENLKKDYEEALEKERKLEKAWKVAKKKCEEELNKRFPEHIEEGKCRFTGFPTREYLMEIPRVELYLRQKNSLQRSG